MKFLVIALTLISQVLGQLFVSEIERNPQGAETESPGGKSHEYIELVNLSNDTFAIAELSLFDGAVRDQLEPKSKKMHVLPGDVCLILDPDYFLQDTPFPNQLDTSAVIATVNHVSLCGGLSESDGFRIDYRGKTVATCYDSTNDDGKYLFAAPVKENESTALSRNGFYFDQSWSESAGSPGAVKGMGDQFYMEYSETKSQIRYAGRSFGEMGSLAVRINGEIAKTSSCGQEILRDSVALPELLNSVEIEIAENGKMRIESVDLSKIRIDHQAIGFSEISPRGEIEWIELYNHSDRIVDLEGWKLYNSEDTVVLPSVKISPKSYAVLADSPMLIPENSTEISLFSLDNYRDTLRLDSPLGKMDSVCWDYTKLPKWTVETIHRTEDPNGFSEKSVQIGSPTPGDKSSLFPDTTPITLKVRPELFTPNGDGVDDTLAIFTTAPSGWNCSIRIFDSRGIEQYRIESAQMTQFWNGVSSAGYDVRRGPFIVLAEFTRTGHAAVVQRTGAVLWR